MKHSSFVVRHSSFSLLLLALLLPLCMSAAAPAATIAVGSKKFPESRLLGEIMAVLIEENAPLDVERRYGLGGTLICFGALEAGEIDLYAEYTGTGLLTILKEPLQDARDPQGVYERVKEGFDKRYDLAWLKPFGFNNSYAIAARPELGVATISGLEAIKNEVRAGFNHEFLKRPDGYPGFIEHYGFALAHVTGLEHGLAYRAIQQGRIDLTDAYATDGKLKKYGLVLLEDDQHFFPPYFAAPVVREATLAAHPALRELLNQLAGRIDQATIVDLNYQVEVEGRSVNAVARQFLIAQGLIESRGGAEIATGRMSLAKLVPLAVEHLEMTLAATGLATLLGVSLGLYVARHPRYLAGPVLGAAGVLQTIPSLAMLGFMIPLLGIGKLPAIVALFLYALLPIVRNTYTGIAAVPPALVEAGRGMGMTRWQLLLQLELPLATRTIMAGVRTALVINIGTATLAAFIGAGGLGEPIVTGLSMNDSRLILWGAIPAALLALACDFLMARLENALEPRGLKLGRR
jgi:osmoprotectant transport system permease protein